MSATQTKGTGAFQGGGSRIFAHAPGADVRRLLQIIVMYPDGMVSYIHCLVFVSMDWNFGRNDSASLGCVLDAFVSESLQKCPAITFTSGADK
jgi:hypothetical protein